MATAASKLVGGQTFDDRLISAREDAFEFGMDLANHLPMVLWALRRIGGTDQDVERFEACYRRDNALKPVVASPGPIEPDTWTDHCGDRAYEAAYRAFFAQELRRYGEGALLRHYLPTLASGVTASAFHALMRLAYAFDAASDEETAKALAYWATTYLSLGASEGAEPRTSEPAAVLSMIAAEPAFRGIEPPRDLLWEFMAATARQPEFKQVHDWLEIDHQTVPKMAQASLRLFAAAMDFASLHALTGTHWLRLVTARMSEPAPLIRAFWQGIAALYPKIGFVAPLDDAQAALLIARPCPDWPEITEAACAAKDEHDISLVFSAREEWRTYGDPLYRIVAARRVGLID